MLCFSEMETHQQEEGTEYVLIASQGEHIAGFWVLNQGKGR
jgi:hypothetical protein